MDEWIYRENGQLVRKALDTDSDGQVDRTLHYDAATQQLTRVEEDDNRDGVSDAWTLYRDGQILRRRADADGDGEPDTWTFYSNGQTRTLGRLGVTTFQNSEGLRAAGNNTYEETPNSGEARFGGGDIRTAGAIISGSLENSNVDTAEQFVRLIEAQRGYQANARVVSTQDEILAETVNLI